MEAHIKFQGATDGKIDKFLYLYFIKKKYYNQFKGELRERAKNLFNLVFLLKKYEIFKNISFKNYY